MEDNPLLDEHGIEYAILDEWVDNDGASHEYRYYASHPSFDDERTLMLVVKNSPLATPEKPLHISATSFTDAFAKEIDSGTTEMTKQIMIQAYENLVHSEDRMKDAQKRREEQLRNL